VREDLGRYQSDTPCETCHGNRLKPEALAVKVGALAYRRGLELSIRDARDWFAPDGAADAQADGDRRRILKEINDRLRFLNDVGLEYLTWRAPRARCRAAKASASAWPRRSARA
jgi:excinuclease ABC subunit A